MPVTYGDALERCELKPPKAVELPTTGIYQRVCSRCDFRRTCGASRYRDMNAQWFVPNIKKSGFCVTFTYRGYNPATRRYAVDLRGFHNGRVV